jgi:flagellar hook-associated protein 2
LASGFDSTSIVDKLVAAERIPENTLLAQKSNAQSRLTILTDLITKLKALKTQSQAVNTPAEVRSFTAASDDDTRVKVTSSSAAAEGTYVLRVGQLARAQTNRSTELVADAATGDGSMDITVAAGSAVHIAYTAGDTLETIAARINDGVAGASASVLNTGTGYRLVVSSKQTGAANAMSFTESGAGLGMSQVIEAKDASVTVNGTTVTRSTNLLSDVIPGVSLQLVSGTPLAALDTTITVGKDAGSTRTKVQGLVDAFNAVAKVVSGQLTYSGATKGTNTLFGDSALQGLQRRLGAVMTSAYAHGTGTVSAKQLGISIGRDGSLTLDAAKLEASIASDPSAVEDLIAGGLSAALSGVADQYSAATTGTLSAKQDSIRTQMTGYDKQVERIETAATSLGDRLRKQFAALEQLMTKLNSQSSYLATLQSQSA